MGAAVIRTSVVLVWLVTTFWEFAYAEEDGKWLCVAEASTGFAYDGERWVTKQFTVEDRKYLVAKSSNTYQFVQLGYEAGTLCGEGPDEDGWIVCKGDVTAKGDIQAKINVKTLRYLLVSLVGYAGERAWNDRLSPHIEMGSCSKI